MKSDLTYLRHIVDAIDAVETFSRDGRDFYFRDLRTQSAIILQLQNLGEAVKNLSDDLTSQYPDVPWRQIAGLRDRLSHQYFNVSLELVWTVATSHLPILRRQIDQILADQAE